eukprot:jgi/Botrbrau1/7433/Bobra.0083s0006.1
MLGWLGIVGFIVGTTLMRWTPVLSNDFIIFILKSRSKVYSGSTGQSPEILQIQDDILNDLRQSTIFSNLRQIFSKIVMKLLHLHDFYGFSGPCRFRELHCK